MRPHSTIRHEHCSVVDVGTSGAGLTYSAIVQRYRLTSSSTAKLDRFNVIEKEEALNGDDLLDSFTESSGHNY